MIRLALKMSRKRKIVIGAVCLLAVGFVAVRGKSSGEAAPMPLAPLVSVVQAKIRNVVDRATVTGTLVPFDEILVTPEVDGFSVIEVLVDEGSVVEKGQVLARLSRGILDSQMEQFDAGIEKARSEIVQAEAASTEAKQALQRTQSLRTTGNATEVQLEQRLSASHAAEGRLSAARNGLSLAEAQRSELRIKLERTDIKAPEGGIVSRKTARVGAVVSAASEPLFRIIAHGRIELEAELTEYQLPRLREGAPALVAIDATQKLEGKVRLISPEVDRKTRLGKVRIALPNDPGLHIGAFASANIELARHEGVAVPATAIIHGAEGATLQVATDNRIETRNIKLGISGDGYVQVLDNLKDGEMVVARAGSFLQNGDSIRVAPAAGQTGGAQ